MNVFSFFFLFFSSKNSTFDIFFVRLRFGVDDLDLVCGFFVAKTSTNETKNKRVKLMKKKPEENDEKEGGMKNKKSEKWHYANCEL